MKKLLSDSPGKLLPLPLLLQTTLIKLTIPLPPFPHRIISWSFLVGHFCLKSFGIPDQSVIVNLHCFNSGEQSTQPIGHPARHVGLMIQVLVIFLVGVHVLQIEDAEKVGFHEDVNDSRTNLEGCGGKKIETSQERKFYMSVKM